MNEEELKKIIFKELKKIAPDSYPETLKPDENIREVIDIDSFDALHFIIALSENLGVDIPEEDYNNTSTIKKLLVYLNGKVK